MKETKKITKSGYYRMNQGIARVNLDAFCRRLRTDPKYLGNWKLALTTPPQKTGPKIGSKMFNKEETIEQIRMKKIIALFDKGDIGTLEDFENFQNAKRNPVKIKGEENLSQKERVSKLKNELKEELKTFKDQDTSLIVKEAEQKLTGIMDGVTDSNKTINKLNKEIVDLQDKNKELKDKPNHLIKIGVILGLLLLLNLFI